MLSFAIKYTSSLLIGFVFCGLLMLARYQQSVALARVQSPLSTSRLSPTAPELVPAIAQTANPPPDKKLSLVLTSMVVAATLAPTPTPRPVPASTVDLETLFTRFSSEYNVDKVLLRRIAYCESGYNTAAVSGAYGGLFQFSSESWAITRASMGLDLNADLRFSAEEAIKTAAYKLARAGTAPWPNCHK